MTEAEKGKYAVGYFESWNIESLLAVKNVAEAMCSPVIIGFSGIYLPHYKRVVKDPLKLYAMIATEVCRELTVPACTVFNESPYLDSVLEAIDYGYNLVMFSDENICFEKQLDNVKKVVKKAHKNSVAVEGEMTAIPGVGREINYIPDNLRFNDLKLAKLFVEKTGVDAFAVNIGQAHLHGRIKVSLDLKLLKKLKETLPVPLVLHGSSSVREKDITEAVQVGINKINVGSILKQSYHKAMKNAFTGRTSNKNPYEVIGSGMKKDILVAGRLAMQKTVEDLMCLFGSNGKA